MCFFFSFEQLADEIERLEKIRDSVQNNKNDSQMQNLNEFFVNDIDHQNLLSENMGIKDNAFSPVSTRSHDGVFLRPGAVSR